MRNTLTKRLDAIGAEKNPRIKWELFTALRTELIKTGATIADDTREYYTMIKEDSEFNQMFIPALENVTFEDLFTGMSTERPTPGARGSFTQYHHKGFTVSGFCSGGHRNATFKYSHVTPSLLVLDYIADNMLRVNHDSIYFEVIEFDTFYRVYVKYNQIIGSRLLAVIDKSGEVQP